jgi:serine/threonine protein kinase
MDPVSHKDHIIPVTMFNIAQFLRMELPRTPQSDIYSFGTMLRCLISVYDELIGSWGTKVLLERPDLLPNVNVDNYFPYSRKLRDIIERSTDREPRHRANLWDIYQEANNEWNKYSRVLDANIKAALKQNRPSFGGEVIAGRDLQLRFKNDDLFRGSVSRDNWYRGNTARIQDISIVARRMQNEMYPAYRDERHRDSAFTPYRF